MATKRSITMVLVALALPGLLAGTALAAQRTVLFEEFTNYN
jgi:hypothetical protein